MWFKEGVIWEISDPREEFDEFCSSSVSVAPKIRSIFINRPKK